MNCIKRLLVLHLVKSPEAKNFAYVGGPNAVVEMGQRNDLLLGEMWIPVVRK